MLDVPVTRQPLPIGTQINRVVGMASSFVLAAMASVVLIINAIVDSFSPVRFGALLVALILLHLMRYRRLTFPREFVLYSIFTGYMILSELWAPDAALGMNTLLPALDFILVLVLFGALMAYHDVKIVLAGILGGFLAGAALYTATRGFPFSYPKDFSYNTIAGMYLFGLFITLLFGWYTRSRLVTLLIGLVLLLHIVATTSIKTNLGILLGAAGAGLTYFNSFARVLRRNAIPLILVAGVVVYAAASNEGVVERVQSGSERVMLGVEILSSRDDEPSGTSYSERGNWMREGIRGWVKNPVFGYGVEAFRADYGITSHSTPIDLLYNTGVVGLMLFYAMFGSIAWRLFHVSRDGLSSRRALIFAALVCYSFITLSGTMHYNSFLAVFIAVGSILSKSRDRPSVELEASKQATSS